MRETTSKESSIQNEISQTVVLAQSVISLAKKRLSHEQTDSLSVPFKVIQGRWPHRLQWQYEISITQAGEDISVTIGNKESHFGQKVVIVQSATGMIVETQTYGKVAIAQIVLKEGSVQVQNAWMPLTNVAQLSSSSRGVLEQSIHMQRELAIAKQAIQSTQKNPLSL